MSDKVSVLVGKSADLRPIYQVVSTDTLPEPYRSAEELREALRGVLWAWEGKSSMGTLYEMDRAMPDVRALLSRMPK